MLRGMVPPTGLPLPFISAGSTSLLVFMSAIGVVLNVDRRSVSFRPNEVRGAILKWIDNKMYTNCNRSVCIFLFVWYNDGVGGIDMKNVVVIHGIGGIEKEPYFPHLKQTCEDLGL